MPKVSGKAAHDEFAWRDGIELVPKDEPELDVGKLFLKPGKGHLSMVRREKRTMWAYVLGSVVAFGALALIACPW
jgi:hypothetical protein